MFLYTSARPPQQIQGRLVKTCLLEAHNRRRGPCQQDK